jgi:hypothetical protein
MVLGAVAFGLSCALAAALSATSYGWFFIYRIDNLRSRRLPFRLMEFFADARSYGVFRQIGGAYEFSHGAFQDMLAAKYPAAKAAGSD